MEVDEIIAEYIELKCGLANITYSSRKIAINVTFIDGNYYIYDKDE